MMDLDAYREPPREPPEPAALRPATQPPEARRARTVALLLIAVYFVTMVIAYFAE